MSHDDAITGLDANALSNAIHAREVSCVETMRAYLARIHRINPQFNAVVSLVPDDTLLAQAAERDAELARGASRGWMHGMPQAIKDLANAAGLPTTLGSPLMRDFVAKSDGLIAQRMKSAGGSSGGAAVALALRLLPVADGSDFMGSLRNPAAWNNVFGIRPSQGRVPLWPTTDVWVTQLGTEGPMGRTVKDVAMLLDVQAGYDARVPLSLAGGERFDGSLDGLDPPRPRIGWLADLDGHLPMEPGILEACSDGLRTLETVGCAIEPTPLGYPPEQVWDAWLVWRRWLVAGRIAPFLLKASNRSLIKPEALWEHDQAANLSGTQALQASVQRSAFYTHMLGLFERFDVLALPSAQVWPFDASKRWPKQIAGRTMDTYHRWMEVVIYATFAGLPCISVPVGFNADGLPMGMQLIGKPRGDFALLRLAHAYEQAAQDGLARAPSAAAVR